MTENLRRIFVPSSVVEALLAHALITEEEEIMGLLFGNVDLLQVATIQKIHVLTRSQKKRDRVEVSDEQLTSAQQEAENCGMRVIGWYHSHPHITILPSHVDNRTQLSYQYLDKSFFGVIVSVYNSTTMTEGAINLIAFQTRTQKELSADKDCMISDDGPPSEVLIPVTITDSISVNSSQQLVQLQQTLANEELAAYRQSVESSQHPLLHIHSASVYEQSLLRIAEYYTLPLLHALQEKNQQNERKEEITSLQSSAA